MSEIKGSVTIDVDTHTDGVSVVIINHDTNEVFEFPYFVMVGFDDGGEYIANNCTIPQIAHGLLRLHDLYDKLTAEAQVNDKPRLRMLPTMAKTNLDI